MKPENFDINNLINSLRNTATSIDEHLPDGMEYNDLKSEDHKAIDAEIFECDVCGWWYDISNLGDNGGHDTICIDCCENDDTIDDDEDDEDD